MINPNPTPSSEPTMTCRYARGFFAFMEKMIPLLYGSDELILLS